MRTFTLDEILKLEAKLRRTGMNTSDLLILFMLSTGVGNYVELLESNIKSRK